MATCILSSLVFRMAVVLVLFLSGLSRHRLRAYDVLVHALDILCIHVPCLHESWNLSALVPPSQKSPTRQSCLRAQIALARRLAESCHSHETSTPRAGGHGPVGPRRAFRHRDMSDHVLSKNLRLERRWTSFVATSVAGRRLDAPRLGGVVVVVAALVLDEVLVLSLLGPSRHPFSCYVRSIFQPRCPQASCGRSCVHFTFASSAGLATRRHLTHVVVVRIVCMRKNLTYRYTWPFTHPLVWPAPFRVVAQQYPHTAPSSASGCSAPSVPPLFVLSILHVRSRCGVLPPLSVVSVILLAVPRRTGGTPMRTPMPAAPPVSHRQRLPVLGQLVSRASCRCVPVSSASADGGPTALRSLCGWSLHIGCTSRHTVCRRPVLCCGFGSTVGRS